MSKVVIKNVDRLLKHLDGIKNVDLINSIKKATLLVEGEAKTLSEPADTGYLKGTIHPKVGRDAEGRAYGQVSTACEYAPYVEFGTGVVGDGTYPKKDLGLTYKGEAWTYPVKTKDGTKFFKTSGQPARAFMYNALHKNEERIKEMIQAEAKKKIDENCEG